VRPVAVDREILADAEQRAQHDEREEPAVVAPIVLGQVDRRGAYCVWQHQRGDHVQADRVHHDHTECDEAPMLDGAQVVHRPHDCTSTTSSSSAHVTAECVHAQARACLHQPAQTLQDLRDREAEDNREQHRQIAERIRVTPARSK
jgi:hypothetical protein